MLQIESLMKKYTSLLCVALAGIATISATSAFAQVEVDPVEVEYSQGATTPQDIATDRVLEVLLEAQAVADNEQITDGEQEIVDQVGGWVTGILTLIGSSSILAAVVGKGTRAGRLIAFIRAILDAFAFNWMNAKNAPPKD